MGAQAHGDSDAIQAFNEDEAMLHLLMYNNSVDVYDNDVDDVPSGSNSISLEEPPADTTHVLQSGVSGVAPGVDPEGLSPANLIGGGDGDGDGDHDMTGTNDFAGDGDGNNASAALDSTFNQDMDDFLKTLQHADPFGEQATALDQFFQDINYGGPNDFEAADFTLQGLGDDAATNFLWDQQDTQDGILAPPPDDGNCFDTFSPSGGSSLFDSSPAGGANDANGGQSTSIQPALMNSTTPQASNTQGGNAGAFGLILPQPENNAAGSSQQQDDSNIWTDQLALPMQPLIMPAASPGRNVSGSEVEPREVSAQNTPKNQNQVKIVDQSAREDDQTFSPSNGKDADEGLSNAAKMRIMAKGLIDSGPHSASSLTSYQRLSIIDSSYRWAFRKGASRALKVAIDVLASDLAQSSTICGLSVQIPTPISREQLEKNFAETLRARCSFDQDGPPAEMSNQIITRNRKIFPGLDGLKNAAPKPSRPKQPTKPLPKYQQQSGPTTAPRVSQTKPPRAAPASQCTTEGMGTLQESPYTSLAPKKDRRDRRKVDKVADFDLVEKITDFQFQGRWYEKHKCSDGKTRMLAPDALAEVKERMAQKQAGEGGLGTELSKGRSRKRGREDTDDDDNNDKDNRAGKRRMTENVTQSSKPSPGHEFPSFQLNFGHPMGNAATATATSEIAPPPTSHLTATPRDPSSAATIRPVGSNLEVHPSQSYQPDSGEPTMNWVTPVPLLRLGRNRQQMGPSFELPAGIGPNNLNVGLARRLPSHVEAWDTFSKTARAAADAFASNQAADPGPMGIVAPPVNEEEEAAAAARGRGLTEYEFKRIRELVCFQEDSLARNDVPLQNLGERMYIHFLRPTLDSPFPEVRAAAKLDGAAARDQTRLLENVEYRRAVLDIWDKKERERMHVTDEDQEASMAKSELIRAQPNRAKRLAMAKMPAEDVEMLSQE